MSGVIVEDRGPIGVQGRRLFQVSIPMDPHEPMMVELPENEMEAVNGETEPVPTLARQKIIAYLVHGGLIAILRSNLSGGCNQPRVWLCLDQLGNVTHTFNPERGVTGGQTAPALAIHDYKIFTSKRAEVLSFVESFGLSRLEAAKVVSEVGTAP